MCGARVMLSLLSRCLQKNQSATQLEFMLAQGLQRSQAAGMGVQRQASGAAPLRMQWAALRPTGRHSLRCCCSVPVAAAETATQQEQQPAQQAKTEQRWGLLADFVAGAACVWMRVQPVGCAELLHACMGLL